MPQRRILIVEDRLSIRTLMTDYLCQQEYVVSQAPNGVEALKLCRSQTYDCVLLDLMMPQMDGMTFLRELRQISMVPVIVMSAKLEEYDKVTALNAGADEYITKPVSLREVLARIQAIIRRVDMLTTPITPSAKITLGSLHIDEFHHAVLLNSVPIPLTNTEYKIMTHMIRNIGKIITRQEFGQILYGDETIKIERSIDMHIKNIRNKIEPDQENPIYILTVYGVGYRMNDAVPS